MEENNNSDNQGQSTQATVTTAPTVSAIPPNKKKSRMLLAVIVLVVVVAAAVIGWLIYQHNQNSATNKVTLHTVQATNGGQLSFSATNGIKQVSASSGQLNMQQTWVTGQIQNVVFLSAVCQSFSSPVNAADLSATIGVLNNPSSTSYPTIAAPLEQFIKDRMTSTWTVTVDKAVAYTNQNIKAAAWSFDFKATDQQNKMQGRLVYSISNNNAYYLLVASNDTNWQANNSDYQAIFASLKIK